MPTYYPPGTRRGHPGYVVRGWIDGEQHELRTTAFAKKGEGGAESWWEDYKRSWRAARGAVPSRATATFDDALTLYARGRDLGRQEARYLRRLGAHFAGRALAGLTLADLQAAAHALYPGCLPQTKNRQAIRPAAAVLHAAAKAGLADWLRVETLPEVDPERPLIYPEELEPFRAAARARGDLALEALLATFQRQGWRVTETIRIERARIDWRRGHVERWVSKSKRWRRAAVDPAVLALWRRLPARPDGRIFPYKDRDAVYRAIDGLGRGRRFRPHMARRGFATALKDEGADIEDIRRAGGWEDPKSVAAYIRDDPARDARILGKIGARIGAKCKKRRKISA
ncbi:MAG TPA: tyrosine-type recombinase/integrase [Thermohalobaculum sp.]|nr:tyrosine-type recombinase/integrase [Thermohalobaculum sp.]